jgi:hypothetical protein
MGRVTKKGFREVEGVQLGKGIFRKQMGEATWHGSLR